MVVARSRPARASLPARIPSPSLKALHFNRPSQPEKRTSRRACSTRAQPYSQVLALLALLFLLGLVPGPNAPSLAAASCRQKIHGTHRMTSGDSGMTSLRGWMAFAPHQKTMTSEANVRSASASGLRTSAGFGLPKEQPVPQDQPKPASTKFELPKEQPMPQDQLKQASSEFGLQNERPQESVPVSRELIRTLHRSEPAAHVVNGDKTLHVVRNATYVSMAWGFKDLYLMHDKVAYDNCDFNRAKKVGGASPLNLPMNGFWGTSLFYASHRASGDRCDGVTIVIGDERAAVHVAGDTGWYDIPWNYEAFLPTSTILVIYSLNNPADDTEIYEVPNYKALSECDLSQQKLSLGKPPLALVVWKPQVRYFVSMCNSRSGFHGATITFASADWIQSLLLMQAEKEMNRALGWHMSVSPSKWERVKFSPGGRVLSLDLSHLKLDSLPVILVHLASLVNLSLSHNHLSGRPPDFLGSLHALQNLDLSHNLFNKNVPKIMSNLRSLTNLNLHLSGIPSAEGVDGISSLRILNLAENKMGLDTFKYLHHLENLQALDLFGNSFFGAFPEDMGNHPHLMSLNLGRCGIQGKVPESIGNLASLTHLNLERNDLDNIDAIGKIRRLQYLNILDFGQHPLSESAAAQLATLPLKKLVIKEERCFSKCPIAKVVQSNPICTHCKLQCAKCPHR